MEKDDKIAVVIAGLIQVFAIVVGFFALGVVMKFNGYPEEIVVRWNPSARGLREYGVWLMLVPVMWVALAFVFRNNEMIIGLVVIFGYLIGFLLLLIFMYAAMNSYRRPLLFSLPTTSASEKSSNSEDAKNRNPR